jgi:hypothetical protein
MIPLKTQIPQWKGTHETNRPKPEQKAELAQTWMIIENNV